MATLARACARLRDWFADEVSPLWAARAPDERHGGFHESLDFEAIPVPGPRRVRVQARQVYTFSKIAQRGWLQEAERVAAIGFEDLLRLAVSDGGNGGCAHLLAEDGGVLDDRRDLYDHAFLLLACAARAQAGDKSARAVAQNTRVFLETSLRAEDAGFEESAQGGAPRRQNPHMHLYEASMALARVGEPAFDELADEMRALFERYFYDRRAGVLREYFGARLSELSTERGDVIEPGHMAEWVWLLAADERAKAARAMGETLFDNALRFRKGEFLPDTARLDRLGAASSRRLWPQTELLKAALTLTREPDDRYARLAASLIEALFDSYLNAPAGLWIDAFDDKGTALSESVPASILYHLFEAAALCEDHSRN